MQRWNDAFAPLRTWVAEAALCVAAEVQRDFRDFRIERGLVTYPDQVALADELLQHPTASRRLREENFRVILDEAQDTDPAQFSVLTEITRPPDATGRWLETETAPPQPGHFCMVGDFQQSIYRDRADLNNYRAIHRALLRGASADELEFSVTFRLDQRQLDFVNDTFRQLLNEKNGQIKFVELQPRPESSARPGYSSFARRGPAACRRKAEGLSESSNRSGRARGLDQKNRARKIARKHVARRGDSLPAKTLAPNHGGSLTT